MDRVVMKLELIKNETLSELNEHFRRKVQLVEETQENEDKIQYKRGVMDCLEKIAEVINKILEQDKIERIKKQRLEDRQAQQAKAQQSQETQPSQDPQPQIITSGDGSHD